MINLQTDVVATTIRSCCCRIKISLVSRPPSIHELMVGQVFGFEYSNIYAYCTVSDLSGLWLGRVVVSDLLSLACIEWH
jgi:hypothetical protein